MDYFLKRQTFKGFVQLARKITKDEKRIEK